MNIVQIVPKLPPSINGLGDYALNLARQLRQDFKIETSFIVGDPNWQGVAEIEGFSISKVSDRSSKTLVSLLAKIDSERVLLHYVGYGYARRGCPIWLIKSLEKWRKYNSERKLVTMFHEVYASSWKPWTSSFFFSLLQKKIASQLANLSNWCVTNREENTRIISIITNNKQKNILTLPVFSTIGEISKDRIPSPQNKTRRIVIFGHRNSRSKVYQKYLLNLEKACELLKIEEIYDIGVSTDLNISQIKGISVIEKGVISAAEIQEILLDSLAGFLCFPSSDKLAKSSIFAAYCAHKLITILPKSLVRSAGKDGLIAGKNYLFFDRNMNDFEKHIVEDRFEIANNAYKWYQDHNLSTQAKVFANRLSI